MALLLNIFYCSPPDGEKRRPNSIHINGSHGIAIPVRYRIAP